MKQVLIASYSEKSAAVLGGLIDSLGDYRVSRVVNTEQALLLTSTGRFGVCVVNAAPGDEQKGLEQAKQIISLEKCAVMLILAEENVCKVSEECEKIGILIVTKPLSRRAFLQSFRLALSVSGRIGEIKTRLDEVKMVERAKGVLIEYLGMTEAMAHRYIEKQAMDTGSKKIKIAENILKRYES